MLKIIIASESLPLHEDEDLIIDNKEKINNEDYNMMMMIITMK